ncbi:hypothetical protein NDU88_007414 [Pleurodeles waltl]|uniref:Uncharacterized protein n=1 Tax=Pleurodeles waltl TaxID=8319 RepID=A0AAV7RPF3_PLEWA|nr:hypothetical protein NDU88_007414 [Pleurodeles waltl]
MALGILGVRSRVQKAPGSLRVRGFLTRKHFRLFPAGWGKRQRWVFLRAHTAMNGDTNRRRKMRPGALTMSRRRILEKARAEAGHDLESVATPEERLPAPEALQAFPGRTGEEAAVGRFKVPHRHEWRHQPAREDTPGSPDDVQETDRCQMLTLGTRNQEEARAEAGHALESVATPGSGRERR